MWKSLLVVLFVVLTARVAHASKYWVSAGGSASNTGSYASPWPSVEYALRTVGGGNTIIVQPGVYRSIYIAPKYAGTQAAPTVIRSETKWKARVIGSPEHGISTGDNCPWVVVDGFEVAGAAVDGIKMYGDHDVVRNCWSHNNSGMGIASHGYNDVLIENNLIEFNGQNIQFHHGIYADGSRLTVRNNVVRHNASFGIHLYPAISHSQVYNNLVYGNHAAGILIVCPSGGGQNQVFNNTSVGNGTGVTIWEGKGEVVANNILTGNANGPIEHISHTAGTIVSHNLTTGDPLFVYPEKRCYWLKTGSPAIGAGTSEYQPPTDFWGRPLKTTAPDIGCFVYVPALAQPAARSHWYEGWPYRFSTQPDQEMPDLWALPAASEAHGASHTTSGRRS
jgi:parallel beta-helix repeat protein